MGAASPSLSGPRDVCTPAGLRALDPLDAGPSDERQSPGTAQHRMPGLPDGQDRRSKDDARTPERQQAVLLLARGWPRRELWLDGACACQWPAGGGVHRDWDGRWSTAAGERWSPFAVVRQVDTWERGRQGLPGPAEGSAGQAGRAMSVENQLDDSARMPPGNALGLIEMPREKSDVASLSRVAGLATWSARFNPQPSPKPLHYPPAAVLDPSAPLWPSVSDGSLGITHHPLPLSHPHPPGTMPACMRQM